MLNTTIGVDSSLSQLLHDDLFYQYDPAVGGCDSWGRFLKSRDLTKALSIQRVVSVSVSTVKLLRDQTDTVTCRDSTLATSILSRLPRASSGYFNATWL